MLKCIAKCSKGYDRCCFNCELKELCDEVCELDPKKCEHIRDTQEARTEKRDKKSDSHFFTICGFLFVITLAVLVIGLSIIGNQNYIMVMLTDVLNNQNTIMVELDKESIDPAAENRSEVNSEAHSIGEFVITHYCSCSECCGKYADGRTASGKPVAVGTVAVDKSIIPLGTKLVIDDTEYVAEDTGSGIHGNRIDIYCDSHSEAISRGKITREVFAY